MKQPLRATLFGLLLLLPAAASAGFLDVVDGIAGNLGMVGEFGEGVNFIRGFGMEGGFPALAAFLVLRIRTVFYAIGVFLLVRAGLKLINSDDENKLSTAKRTIAGTLIGFMLAYLSPRFVDVFVPDEAGAGGLRTPEESAALLATEVAGIIDWVLTAVAVLGILMIIISGIQAIANFGKEDGAAQVKRTVFGTMGGIFMLIVAGAVKATLGLAQGVVAANPGAPNPMPVILRGMGVVQTVLTFLNLIAVLIVVYAGFLMVLNFGNEEQFNKAKSLLYRMLLGLAVIVLANLAVAFIVSLFAV